MILYLSVLLHEASHALMARRYGFPVSSITLHFLGGMTAIEGEARTPRQEFLIAVVGPLTSLAVGAASPSALRLVTPDGLLLMAVEGLAGANLLVGVLNLVPGLPLDGGRVLKSAVWRVTGNVAPRHDRRRLGRPGHRGRRAWPGRVLQEPLLRRRRRHPRLRCSRSSSRRSCGPAPPRRCRRARLRQPAARTWSPATLARRALAVPDDLPLAEAVRRAQEAERRQHRHRRPSSGDPVGIVNEAAAAATPEDRRPWLPVSRWPAPSRPGCALPADIAGEELVDGDQPAPRPTEYLLVEPDGSVFGVLSTADVDRAFRESAH